MQNNNTPVAAFQTWSNGGIQTSGMCIASRDGQEAVDAFIERHNESGTFATLHTFTCEDEAWDALMSFQNQWEAQQSANATAAFEAECRLMRELEEDNN